MTGSATRTNQVPVLVAGRVGGTAPVASMALLVATPSSHAESGADLDNRRDRSGHGHQRFGRCGGRRGSRTRRASPEWFER